MEGIGFGVSPSSFGSLGSGSHLHLFQQHSFLVGVPASICIRLSLIGSLTQNHKISGSLVLACRQAGYDGPEVIGDFSLIHVQNISG